MLFDILTRNIGDEFVVTIFIHIENQSDFVALIWRAKSARPEKKPKLEGHVETR